MVLPAAREKWDYVRLYSPIDRSMDWAWVERTPECAERNLWGWVESRRAAEGIRSKLLTKGPHSGRLLLSAELVNVQKLRETPRNSHHSTSVANGEIPVKFRQNFTKI